MLECKTCAKTFTGYESYNQHIESEKHKKKMLNTSKQQNSSFDDSDVTSTDTKCNSNTEIKCKVCDLSFNSFENFENHSLSPEHALKIMLSQSEGTQSSSSVNNDHKLNATKLKEESILPELNSSQPYFGNCSICCKIFSGPEPYKQHIESQAHKKKVSLLQNQNVGTNLTLRCDPCDKSFSGQVPYVQHMSSETHKKKLQNIELVNKYLSATNSSISQATENKVGEKKEIKLWFCDICNVQCSGLVPYEQHMGGSIHLKNAKRAEIQKSFMKIDNSIAPMMQANNFNQGQISERSEDNSKLVNSNYQNDNEKKENDFILPGKINGLKTISCEELGEIIKVITPDEKINFDELYKTNNSFNDEDFKKIQIDDENGLEDNIKKKPEEEMKAGVYQLCKICNIPLLDKDSAAEHFESKEHYEKRWK